MFSTDDTIVAIATPPGRGGIGVVRLSGPRALDIALQQTNAEALEPRRATLAGILLPKDSPDDGATRHAVDEAVVTYFPSPRSYTGEDVIEISAHGSPVILRAIVESAMRHGARLAEPGEFTLRAYLHSRIDLVQAEAVADLVDAVTPLQARVAFDQLQGTLTRLIGELHASLFDLIARLEASVDFPDEGYHFADPVATAHEVTRLIERAHALVSQGRRGRLIREGLQVAIIGPPNAGKSSLFNALVGANRAIVTEIPGTTRDLVTETVDIEGIRVTLADTAGLRESPDIVEKEGVSRARAAAVVADLVLYVADRSRPRSDSFPDEVGHQPKTDVVVVANKADLAPAWTDAAAFEVSATTGLGIEALKGRIARTTGQPGRDEPAITNVRHVELINRARSALERARLALTSGEPLSEEFVLADLQDARAALEEVTGRKTSDDVLAHIFERFCIGK